MKKKLMVLSGLVLLTPALVFAQSACTPLGSGGVTSSTGTLFNFLCTIKNLFNTIIPVLVALGVVYFVWGVITYVIASDEEAKKSGRDRMIYGIIGLAVIIGLWGLVGILGNTFNIGSDQNPEKITLPGVEL